MNHQNTSSSLTVLVIDSDVQVLTHCAQILQEAQHHVLMATGCSQAEMLCGWYEQEVHLILADVMLYATAIPSAMPQPSSDQLAGDRVFRLAHRKWPFVRMALMSAAVIPPPELAWYRFGLRFRYLPKPIERTALLRLAEPTQEGSPIDTCVGGYLYGEAGQIASP